MSASLHTKGVDDCVKKLVEAVVSNDIRRQSLALTLRLGFVSVLGLVSVRIVLKALGVDDYGTYCAVESLVWASAFLNSSVTDSTTRFITYALGEGDSKRLQTVFSTSFWLHCAIGLLLMVAMETLGLWCLNEKLTIPPERQEEARIVFHLVLLSMVIGFLQQPYTSLVLAHEKFKLYGYIEIAEAALSLVALSLIMSFSGERLVVYAAMMLAARIIIAGVYVAYSTAKFKESRLVVDCDAGIVKKMLVFSGCGVYGNMCVTAYGHINPLVLNTFFGVAANTSTSVAASLSGMVSGFAVTGIYQAYAPCITKSYAAASYRKVDGYLCGAVKSTVYAFGLLLVPVVVYMPEILKIWLGEVPHGAVEFSRYVMLTSLLAAVIGITNTAIHATGDIRRLSFVNGSMYLLCPLLSWVAYKAGAGVSAMFAIDLAVTAMILVNGCFIIRAQIPGIDAGMYAKTICRSVSAVTIVLAAVWLLHAVFCA